MEHRTNSDYLDNPDLLTSLIQKVEAEGTSEEREQMNRFLGALGLYNAFEDNPSIVRGES